MNLGELIAFLEKQDQEIIPLLGFHNPHSYRGNYHDLAFEPTVDKKISELLAIAKSALGETYIGWKGGEFRMDNFSDVWLANRGCSGEPLSLPLLKLLCGQIPTVDDFDSR